MPTNAVSSTPARSTFTHDQSNDDQPSWSASLESPMVRLDRELQSFAREAEEEPSASDSFAYEEENTVQQPINRGKGSSGLHRDLLQSSMQSTRIPRSALPTPRANVSPLKVKPKTPIAIPKHLQPYLPPTSQAEPTLISPRRTRYERSPRKPSATSSTSSTLDIPSLTQHLSDPNSQEQFADFNDSFDDSVDLMQGMSPPRTMAFARAPRSSVGLGLLPPLGRTPGRDLLPALGRTPAKEAADRIRRDLLGDMQSHFGSASSSATNRRTPAFGYGRATTKDDTMSTIPTPPSLSRYMRHAYPSRADSNDTDASLESMMRRVGLGLSDSSSKTNAIASSSRSGDLSQRDLGAGMHAPPVEEELYTPDQHASGAFHFHQDDESAIQPGSHSHPNSDSDSDSDSLNDEPAHPGQPSTAFLMASSRDPGPDDSFGSSNSNHSIDSLGEEGFGGGDGAAVHPFARALEAGEGDGFDDSFDSVEGDGFDVHQEEDHNGVEETVFGIPPARRQRGGVKGNGELWLLGENLLQDTIGIGSQLAKAGRVDESPTPFGRG
jgi:DASH complex subunit ASK1